MCGRCNACNCVLNEEELSTRWPGTNTFIDLCFSCIAKSDDDWEPDVPNQQLELFDGDDYERMV